MAEAGLNLTRKDFETELREWLTSSDRDDTVGEVGNAGVKGWTYVEELGRVFRLHADTTAEGVSEYLRHLEEEPDGEWRRVKNELGRKNKVGLGREKLVFQGFYLYEHGI